ncbi:MAG: hypothetical protein H7249_05615 [Chitinophagaceae bacterium]|nr:hypothetical protein [Oligoflexus sp.]
MKNVIFGFHVMASLVISTSAFASGNNDDVFDVKSAKVYFRCESDTYDFNSSTQMHEVSPGRFVWTGRTKGIANKDKCIVSVVDGSAKGEYSFVDFLVKTTQQNPVTFGKTYHLDIGSGNDVFDVEYASSGKPTVEFELKNRSLTLKNTGAKSIARVVKD